MPESTEPRTADLLDRLERIARAATPGPWEWVVNADDTPAVPIGEPYACEDGWVEQFLGHGSGEYAQVSLRTTWTRPTNSGGRLPRFLVNYCEETSAADAAFIAACNPTVVLDLIARIRQAEATR